MDNIEIIPFSCFLPLDTPWKFKWIRLGQSWLFSDNGHRSLDKDQSKYNLCKSGWAALFSRLDFQLQQMATLGFHVAPRDGKRTRTNLPLLSWAVVDETNRIFAILSGEQPHQPGTSLCTNGIVPLSLACRPLAIGLGPWPVGPVPRAHTRCDTSAFDQSMCSPSVFLTFEKSQKAYLLRIIVWWSFMARL